MKKVLAALALGSLTVVLVPAVAPSAGAATASRAWTAAVPQGDEAAGEIVDFELLPDVLTVAAGTTITWTNGGGRPHTVTDRGGMFDTGPILPGETGSATPSIPGTYEVFCRINPSRMNARIVVEAGGQTKGSRRIQALDEAREGESLRFDPPDLEVVAGTSVVLANVGGQPHAIRADDDSFRIPVVEPGAEGGRFAGGNRSVVVDEPGTYGFFCDIHPDTMRGTLVVTPAPAGAPDEETTTTEAATTTTEAPERPPPEDDGDDGDGDGDGDGGGAAADASIVDFEFAPIELAVDPGDEITWRNDGESIHLVVFDDLEINTGPIDSGDTVSATAPDDPGTFSYFCAIHPEMRGVLLVRPPAVVSAPPARPDEPADGTIVAYGLALVFLVTGGAGLALGLRR